MSSPLCSRTQFFFLVAAILAGNCAVATAAIAQNKSAELPANCSAYASVPLPAEANKFPAPKTPPACASYRSYRGLGRPVNYSQARVCAWRERLAQKAGLRQNAAQPTAWVVGGSLILADIYINGAGVKRNIPLAMYFACEFEPGTAMLALPDVRKFARSQRSHKRFEFCDYAASTISMDFCGDYESQIDDARRSHYYHSLKSSMTPEQQAAFTKLLAAENAYITTHASEVDQGGTIRAIRTMGSQSILEDLFHTEVVQFERKEWPRLPERQTQMANVWLQHEYKKRLKQLGLQSKDDIDEGAVSASNLTKVEKVWNNYRDAWVAFARLRYPDHVATIQAKITLDRYRYVKTISAY